MNIVTAMPDFKRKHDTLLLWIHWLNLLVEPTYDLKLLRSMVSCHQYIESITKCP